MSAAGRVRLDQLLVDRGLARSRSHARALILAGSVELGESGRSGSRALKPGTLVDPEAPLALEEAPRYVGRGGDKLEAALDASGIDPRDRVALDIGASTGGFTDCLLQRGARCVVAVDVGHGQLDWNLRRDSRVHVLERVNARYLEIDDLPDELPGRPDLSVMDVSFIGIGKVLPAVARTCATACDALILVKPQFECGPEAVGSGGVVRDAAARRAALFQVAEAAHAGGWTPVAAIPSPIRGAGGNWECFLQLGRGRSASETPEDAPDDEAWRERLERLAVPDDTGAAVETTT